MSCHVLSCHSLYGFSIPDALAQSVVAEPVMVMHFKLCTYKFTVTPPVLPSHSVVIMENCSNTTSEKVGKTYKL